MFADSFQRLASESGAEHRVAFGDWRALIRIKPAIGPWWMPWLAWPPNRMGSRWRSWRKRSDSLRVGMPKGTRPVMPLTIWPNCAGNICFNAPPNRGAMKWNPVGVRTMCAYLLLRDKLKPVLAGVVRRLGTRPSTPARWISITSHSVKNSIGPL